MLRERIEKAGIIIENARSFINRSTHNEKGTLRWKAATIGFGGGSAYMTAIAALATGIILTTERILGQPLHEPAQFTLDQLRNNLPVILGTGLGGSAIWLGLTTAFRIDAAPTNFLQRFVKL